MISGPEAMHLGKYGSMQLLNPEFWSGKSVFLTGHTGFKGTWMTHVLHLLGARVHGYALAPITSPNKFEVTDAEKCCSSHTIADLANVAALQTAMTNSAPDIMIHMAAQPIVSSSYIFPAQTFATNVMGTVNFLECVRQIGEGIALVVSSDKCYLNDNKSRDFVEEDPLGGHDPYSASKAGTELVVNSWRSSFFGDGKLPVKLASVRAGNVIGGADWSEDRLLPDAVKAFSQGNSLTIRNPLATRPWQHVLEPVSAYLYLIQCMAERDDLATGWNVGPIPSKSYTVREVVDVFKECWPNDKVTCTFSDTVQGFSEAKTLALDSTKFARTLRWKPVLQMPEAVKWTADWYSVFYEDGPSAAAQKTKSQISEYLFRFSSGGGNS